MNQLQKIYFPVRGHRRIRSERHRGREEKENRKSPSLPYAEERGQKFSGKYEQRP